MCIAIVCVPSCDVLNLPYYKINPIFLIKPFFHMTKKSRQNRNILKVKYRAFFIIFEGLKSLS